MDLGGGPRAVSGQGVCLPWMALQGIFQCLAFPAPLSHVALLSSPGSLDWGQAGRWEENWNDHLNFGRHADSFRADHSLDLFFLIRHKFVPLVPKMCWKRENMPTPSVTLGLWLVGGVISSLKGFKKERKGKERNFILPWAQFLVLSSFMEPDTPFFLESVPFKKKQWFLLG